MHIFINYRRQDYLAAGLAHRIYNRLAERFGNQEVFIDEDTIPPGIDFKTYISDAIRHSDVVLVLVGPQWLDLLRDRDRETVDYVRLEIELAFQSSKPVLPILLGPTKMPQIDDLPTVLRNLALCNARTIDSGRKFDSDTERLIHELERYYLHERLGEVVLEPISFRQAKRILRGQKDRDLKLMNDLLYAANLTEASGSVRPGQLLGDSRSELRDSELISPQRFEDVFAEMKRVADSPPHVQKELHRDLQYEVASAMLGLLLAELPTWSESFRKISQFPPEVACAFLVDAYIREDYYHNYRMHNHLFNELVTGDFDKGSICVVEKVLAENGPYWEGSARNAAYSKAVHAAHTILGDEFAEWYFTVRNMSYEEEVKKSGGPSSDWQ